MKRQLIWVFESRKSVHYWWSYVSFASECKELTCMLDVPSIIQVGCPTCCYQVCALNHAKVGNADPGYPSEPCHRNVLSRAQSKLRLCSANHRTGYWSNLAQRTVYSLWARSNLPCDWLSTVWAYSKPDTENVSKQRGSPICIDLLWDWTWTPPPPPPPPPPPATPITAHAKTTFIFHTFKPSCWILLLWTESIICPQLNVLISKPVIRQNKCNQPMMFGLTVPSRPVAVPTGSELVQCVSSFYSSRPSSESKNVVYT